MWGRRSALSARARLGTALSRARFGIARARLRRASVRSGLLRCAHPWSRLLQIRCRCVPIPVLRAVPLSSRVGTISKIQGFLAENGSSQGLNMALAGFFMPNILDSRYIECVSYIFYLCCRVRLGYNIVCNTSFFSSHIEDIYI